MLIGYIVLMLVDVFPEISLHGVDIIANVDPPRGCVLQGTQFLGNTGFDRLDEFVLATEA